MQISAPIELALPNISLELIEDLSPTGDRGFLSIARRRYVIHYPDGSTSAAFVYDEVLRAAIDAVVIAAHFVAADGARRIYLVSAVRPPIVMRTRSEGHEVRGLWELPAGLVEPSEQDEDGARRAAARELEEEVGLCVPTERLLPLGLPTLPAPGLIAERHIYFETEVDADDPRTPRHDGVLEHFSSIVTVGVQDALSMCERGEIIDGKTEIALHRLAAKYR
jgi:ADP-ribose pyrophosphatase